MKKLLITGGAGVIGSNLANFYSQQYQVFVIDDLSMGRVSNLQQTEQLVFIKESSQGRKGHSQKEESKRNA